MDGALVTEAEKAYAAWVFFNPSFGPRAQHPLLRALRAIRGMRALDPPLTRPPAPWPHVALICLGE
eukprot:10633279-Lingulodinium_polyedra.AAC.1